VPQPTVGVRGRILLAVRPVAATVSDMIDDSSIASLALGDIVTLADGRSLTVRAHVALTLPVGVMAGFILLGEMELLLSVPAIAGAPFAVYLPVERFPSSPQHARSAAEGATRYWSPHLPALGQAMGEVFYRVVEVRGTTDPVVIVYRGPEAIVFVRSGFTWGGELDIVAMPRDPANEDVDVVRHAADVSVIPAYVPAPAEIYQSFTVR
jgi:hypothetical protein